MKKWFCLFLWMILATMGQVYALENKILFNRLDVNNGLSSNEVSCIYKDTQGFMWFGTGAGLARFDGYEFKTFRHEVNGSLFSEAFILKLTETKDGRLWITYQDDRISIFDPYKRSFQTVAEYCTSMNLSNSINSVFQDKEYKLLFVDDNNKLCKYDYTTGETKSIQTDPEEGFVCDVAEKGNAFYLVYNSGTIEIVDLLQPQSRRKEEYLKPYSDLKGFYLFVDSDNELWIYMHPDNYSGLYRYNPEKKKWTHYSGNSSIPLSSSFIRDVEEDDDGNLWIATDHGGINILDKKRNTVNVIKSDPFDQKSISQNSVICLYKDDTGILWGGTYKNGINYYHKSIIKFATIRYPISLAEDVGINDCNSVYEDKKGNLWIGTNGKGLLHYNRSTGEYRRYQHDPSNPSSLVSNIIVCMDSDKDGNLWIGTYMGGLDCFDGKKFTHYRCSDSGLSNNSIYSLYADDNDKLWIGTLGGGLNRLDLNTRQWKHYSSTDPTNPILADIVYSLSRGGKNELLVGTASGLNILDMQTGNVRTFTGTRDGSTPFHEKAINTTHLDKRQLLWIGSNNGLSIYDIVNDRLYDLDKTNGLPDNDIMSIMQDDNYTLWLGSKNGLLKITPVYNEKDRKYHFDCSVYYENEGVQGRVFNRNSTCYLSCGEVIFGGTNGLTIFNPLQIEYNSFVPKVVFSDIYIQNQAIWPGKQYNGKTVLDEDISYTKKLSLEYEDRSFTLNISALNYFLPEKNKFSFIMEGFDKAWTTVDAGNRNITYTNLPSGDYTFQVRAVNNDGVWSVNPVELQIRVEPPFWATTWAIAFYVLLSILLIYGIIKTILRYQKRKFEKEQEQIAVKRLHEMDEMKLRFFTNVSHEFRTPLTLIIAPLEKLIKGENNSDNKKILQLIQENAQQLLSLVNQLLDFRKIDVQGVKLLLSSGDIVLFVRNITHTFKELSEQKNIRFTFSTSLPSITMRFDTDKIFKIVSNLLSNAFKFTPEGGEISVTLHLQQEEKSNYLLIQVTDTGIGIEEDKCELIFNRFYQVPSENEASSVTGTGIGLHICREFVKLHDGTISVESKPGKGSTFTVSLPLALSETEEVISAPEIINETGPEEVIQPQERTEKPLLLGVDDNAKFREFMKLSLKDSYDILMAADGEEAWTIILDKLPDMIISDVMMPVTDGITLCKRIKQDIRTSHIPVILLTAKSAEASKIIGLEAGADDYIGKPFNMEMLLLKINHLIELRNRMQQKFMQPSKGGIQLTDIHISSLDEELMKKSITFIEEHLADPELSVEWLSREMGMSRANFYKKTSSITGKTPVELIRTIRLKRAALLLEKSQLRVNEVAFQVGFNDNKLFRKYFKDEFGCLPSDYVSRKKEE